MEPLWLTHAKRLQAIASTGLHFSRDPFDRERFLSVLDRVVSDRQLMNEPTPEQIDIVKSIRGVLDVKKPAWREASA